MLRRVLILMVAFTVVTTAYAQAHEMVTLWPGAAPGAVGDTDADKPHLEIFQAAGVGPHPVVLVAPGGGYINIVNGKEGTAIAKWLNDHGVSAFVLTYRIAPRYVYPTPMIDGYRAMRFVRANAAKYDVDPHRIGMWGFSAGAHMTGMVATHFDAGNPASADPVEQVSDRPDFCISSYGRLSYDPAVDPPETLLPLRGPHPAASVAGDINPVAHVTAQTPPFFLYSTTTDQKDPVRSTVEFYLALLKAGVPAEMHVFGSGPHGSGLGEKYPGTLDIWPTLLADWMRANGWMPAAVAAGSQK